MQNRGVPFFPRTLILPVLFFMLIAGFLARMNFLKQDILSEIQQMDVSFHEFINSTSQKSMELVEGLPQLNEPSLDPITYRERRDNPIDHLLFDFVRSLGNDFYINVDVGILVKHAKGLDQDMNEIHKIGSSESTEEDTRIIGYKSTDDIALKLDQKGIYEIFDTFIINGLPGFNIRSSQDYTGIFEVKKDINPVFIYLHISPFRYYNPVWITRYNYITSALWLGLLIILVIEHILLGRWHKENSMGVNRWIPSFLSIFWLNKGLFFTVLVLHICVLLAFVLYEREALYFDINDYWFVIILLVVEGLFIWLQFAYFGPLIARKLFRTGQLTKGLYKGGKVMTMITRKSGSDIHVLISYEYEFLGEKISKNDTVFRPERFLLLVENKSELDIYVSPITGRKSVLVDNYTY